MDVRCTAVVVLMSRETGTRRTACVVAVLVKQPFYKAKDADQLVASHSTSTYCTSADVTHHGRCD